jgi:asparagine synthase (glutamine-hydrolysing)
MTTAKATVPATTEVRQLDGQESPGWLAAWDKLGSASRLLIQTKNTVPQHADGNGLIVLFQGFLNNRDELKSLVTPAPPVTTDDASLVLQAYRLWGESALRRFQGVFVLVIGDMTRGVLLAARDPLGFHPLFYSESPEGILLSPSLAALLEHSSVSRAINRAALADHLINRWPKAEETFLAAINRVPQGRVLRVQGGLTTLSRYWDPLPSGVPVKWADDDELSQFDPLLERAVGRCLGHGPAGIFLSGGLDSVSVAAVAADHCRRRNLPSPLALSLAFPDTQCNEEPAQKGVASVLCLPHVLVGFADAVGPRGLLQESLDLSAELPLPLLNPWLPAYRSLAELGKARGCRTILTGGGGDEWLSVSPALAADLLGRLDVGGLARLVGSTHRSHVLPPWDMLRYTLWTSGAELLLREIASGAFRRILPRLYHARRRRRIRRSIPDWLARDPLLRREIEIREEQNLPRLRLDGFLLADTRDSIEHPVMSMEMEELFELGRRLGMRILQPFWDAELITLLYRALPRALEWGGRNKGLVRKALARRFPGLRFQRHKKVLATNFFRSIMLHEAETAYRALEGLPILTELGIINAKAFEPTIAAVFAGNWPPAGGRFYDLLMLEAWLRPRV